MSSLASSEKKKSKKSDPDNVLDSFFEREQVTYRRDEERLKLRMQVFTVVYVVVYFISLTLLAIGTIHRVQAPVSILLLSLQFIAMSFEIFIFIKLFLEMRKRHNYEYKRTKKTMLV